jgi:hypothetical protein
MSTAQRTKPRRNRDRHKSKVRSRPSFPKSFLALTGYMSEIAKGTMGRHTMFSMCVKASAAKCFELNLAIPQATKSKSVFFLMASLRGVCEDLIVLRFIGKLPPQDRNKLLSALSIAELGIRTKLQDTFFTAVRPQQPVLRIKDVDIEIARSEANARLIWAKHGWRNLNRGSMPQIRQIAERQGLHQLAILYDYLYRLSSAAVHFNVQSLLRSGWGKQPNMVFSTKNFDAYFAAYCSLYGAFLFCLYFEFFASVLRPSPETRAIVDKIREQVLLAPRWPEMVTFEEMNQSPPKGANLLQVLVTTFQAVSRKRLISWGVNYTSKRSSERRQIVHLLKLLKLDDVAAAQRARSNRKADTP